LFDRNAVPGGARGRRVLRAVGTVVALALLLAACGAPATGSSGAPSGATKPSGDSAASGPGGAASQPAGKPSTVPEIALYQGADREQVLLDGARAEGGLVFYNSLTWMDTVAREFEKKYPFVQVEIYRADSNDLTSRLINEHKAGRYTVDVIETTPEALAVLDDEGLLQEYWSPDLAAYPAETQVKGKQGVVYWGDRENHVGLGFNTSVVPPGEAPRTLDDLLDPRWKGKMTIAGSSTGVNWLGTALDVKGRDYVQRLASQEVKVQNVSGAALAQLVVSGEVPLSPTIFDSNIYTAKEKGAPVEWHPLEPVVSNLGYSTIIARAPHPHAALLFLDYLHSREGQEVVLKGGLSSPRSDVGSLDARYQKTYMRAKYSMAEYEKHFEEWERLMKQLFIRS
jgi:iron(III) transport system substrate-binding protein